MHITLCTIGFTGKSAEEFFALLRGAGVRHVLDVRENRVGQLSGYAKYPDIAFFLREIGQISYRSEPDLAPSPEIRKAYRASKDWNQYEPAFLALLCARGIIERLDPEQFAETTALLCSEPGPEKCHRRLVADLLGARWRAAGHSIEVQHLALPSKPQKIKKKQDACD